MARNWTRRLTVAVVVPLTACAVVVSTALPASANGTAAGIAQNAWLVSDLAAQAANTAQRMPYDPVLEAELTTAAAATTSTTAKPGVKAKPKASGKLGLIINTAVVLGGLALEFGGGEAEPALPAPSTGGGTWVTPVGSATCTLNPFDGTPGWPKTYKVMWSAGVGGTCQSTAGYGMQTVGGQTGNWWQVAGEARPEFPARPFRWCQGCASVSFSPKDWPRTVTNIYEHWTGTEGNAPSGTMTGRVWVNAPADTATPTAPVTDPAVVPRYIDSEITCKSASGGSQVFTQRTGPFTITPGQPNTLPEAPQMSCPDGTWLQSGKRELSTQGTTERVPLTEPYQAPDWLPEQVTANPNCWPAGATKCQLEVVRIGTTPEYACNSIPVGSGGHPCRDWWSDPRRPDRYECRFGGKVLSLKRCEPYKRSWTIADGGPTLDRTPTEPDAPPAPPPPVDTDPTPDKTPDAEGCVPGWSELLSPWWVFKAASCALAWAFVPPPGHLDGIVVGLRDDWAQTTPGLWIGKLTGMVNVPAGSCGGIPVDFNLGYGVGVDMRLGEACSGSMANAASIVKLAVTAVICVGGAFAGVRILGSGLGWAPGIGKGVDA